MLDTRNLIDVLIADDHYHEREGLKQSLLYAENIRVVAEASSAQEAFQKTVALRPDVVIMDLDWYGDRTAGITAIQKIKQQMPRAKVLVVTNFPELIESARAVGADVAVTKDALINGETIAARIWDAYSTDEFDVVPPADGEILSVRERQVLDAMRRGLETPEIARELFIADATVKKHREHIREKLGAKNAAEAVFIGLKLGLIPFTSQNEN